MYMSQVPDLRTLPCSRWNSFLLMGIFFIILGTVALFSAFISTLSTVILFGILLTASGISHLIHAFWTPEWKGFFGQIILGILATVIGWLLVMNPTLGAVSLTLLLAAFFIASGLFKIVSSLMYHGEHWGWLLANGILSLILGILVYAQWPAASLWIIGMFIGIDLIFTGWSNILLALFVRKRCNIEPNVPHIS